MILRDRRLCISCFHVTFFTLPQSRYLFILSWRLNRQIEIQYFIHPKGNSNYYKLLNNSNEIPWPYQVWWLMTTASQHPPQHQLKHRTRLTISRTKQRCPAVLCSVRGSGLDLLFVYIHIWFIGGNIERTFISVEVFPIELFGAICYWQSDIPNMNHESFRNMNLWVSCQNKYRPSLSSVYIDYK